MRSIAKVSLGAILVLLLTVTAMGRENTNFFTTSPPSPIGSGARAMGVGGAFIAVGDDATAASWNPACLIQLEKPEAGAAVTYDNRDLGGNRVDFADANFLSASYPFTVKTDMAFLGQNNINMILSFSYQRLFDFYFRGAGMQHSEDNPTNYVFYLDADPSFPNSIFDHNSYDAVGISRISNFDYASKQIGSLGALAPAFAIQLNPKLSLGVTYNFWRDGWLGSRLNQRHVETLNEDRSEVNVFKWDINNDCFCGGAPCSSINPISTVDNPECMDEMIPVDYVGGSNPLVILPFGFTAKNITETQMRLSGTSYNLGLLYDINGHWSVGAVYRSPANLDVDVTLKTSFVQTSSDGSLDIPLTKTESKYNDHLTFPESYGIGVGYRYSDALSFTGDVTRVNWNEYVYEYEEGDRFSLVDGLKTKKADISPTYTARAGAEYLIIKPKYVVPIRGGFFYDPEPAKHQPDDFWGITAGSGFAFKWLALDLTYYYRFGNDVVLNTTVDASHEILKGVKRGDVSQHMVMFSAIAYFE